MQVNVACALGLVVVAVLALWVPPGAAVDRSKFKTCAESGFCQRNRNAEATVITLEDGTLLHDQSGLHGVLVTPAGARLQLHMVPHQSGSLRVRIVEETPLRPRYEPTDVLLPLQPLAGSWNAADRTLTWLDGAARAVVTSTSPFQVELWYKEHKVVTVNQDSLFRYEHQTTKEEGAEYLHSEWEESFESHTDSKPFGPQSFSMDFTFWSSSHLYGIPEHAADFRLKPTKGAAGGQGFSDPYRLYNLDVFEYEVNSEMALYGHVPLVMSHTAAQTAAVFWLNAAETWVDVWYDGGANTAHTHWMSESGMMDFFLLPGPNPSQVFKQYGALTGTTALPPQWSLGYHQCKWNYKDEAEVAEVDAGFDEWDIPYDVIWLDIEHTDGKKYFTWDSRHFPTPEAMQDAIAAKGRRMVTIVDPHIKREAGYATFDEASAQRLFVKNKDLSDFEGWCWPGSSSWVDYLSEDIRKWWASRFAYDVYKGSTSILFTWNDMNEPSVFNGPEVTMQKDLIHAGDWEHRDVHNVYGMLMHNATAVGQVERNTEVPERPFVLSRALFAGTQRVGPIWTGDNTANWDHLRASIPMLLSLNVAGISFSGADVGGFFGNPNAELLTRWMQAAVFQPFFRGHGHLDTKRREPWLFGEPYVYHMRDALRLRYKLLPYVYTVFHENAVEAEPVMRPLWVEWPQDERVFGEQEAHMFGSALLTKPVTAEAQATQSVYLPGSDWWYDLITLERYVDSDVTIATPLGRIVAFVRGGSIVPTKERARRSSTQQAPDPYTLTVALGKSGVAQGHVYQDDGYTFAYKKGEYADTQVQWSANGVLQAQRLDANSRYHPPTQVERIVVLGLPSEPSSITLTAAPALGKPREDRALTWDWADNVLTIRKPDVRLHASWSITLA